MLLLTFGLVARVTRLITDDYLLRHLRAMIIRRFGPNHDLAYLVTCAWCMSIWVGGGLFTVAYFYGHTAAYLIVAAGGTSSYLYGAASTFIEGGRDA
ncbi:hypothetical protein AXK61_12860 [Tsukamurella pseudospumae]|uniref:DUF1360 domain-containing protein n=1 Tax=Tsukamurella pseudospumae TaxID=239498 RepID=A0A137ZRR4_9ACTN|nr:hypothetical protein AXK61_12860 [Tsukamurella pseudospumae]